MWTLENAQYWPAFLAVLIPPVIHLWKRKNPDINLFPTLRFLEQNESVLINEIRIHQWPLMAFRMFLLALFALILLGPVYVSSKPSAGQAKKWILSHHSVLANTAGKEQIYNYQENGYSLKVMDSAYIHTEISDGLVNYNLSSPISSWQALKKLENVLTDHDSVIILADPAYELFEGMRPKTPAAVTYKQLPPGNEIMESADSIYFPGMDKLLVGRFSDGNWIYQLVSSNNSSSPRMINPISVSETNAASNNGIARQVAIISRESVSPYQSWFVSAFEVLNDMFDLKIEWTITGSPALSDSTGFDLSILLDSDPPPDSTNSRLFILIEKEFACEHILFRLTGTNTWIFCPNDFNEWDKIPEYLPIALLKLLYEDDNFEQKKTQIKGLITHPTFGTPEFEQLKAQIPPENKESPIGKWLYLLLFAGLAAEYYWSGRSIKIREDGK